MDLIFNTIYDMIWYQKGTLQITGPEPKREVINMKKNW